MTDDRLDKKFDELMRDAARTYRRPPEAPGDEMWASIEAQLPAVTRPVATVTPLPVHVVRRGGFRVQQWAAIAATLLVGIAIGRGSATFSRPPVVSAPVTVAASSPTAPRTEVVASMPYGQETSRYLGQTAALLIALPSEMKSGKTNEQFMTRAGDLLTTTRMLIDSPASNDPAMRNLLEDLELVLAQVVRLQNNSNRTEIDLINRALEQRDVLPRLRKAAVADISAN